MGYVDEKAEKAARIVSNDPYTSELRDIAAVIREVIEDCAQEAFSFEIDWAVGIAENLGMLGGRIRALATPAATPRYYTQAEIDAATKRTDELRATLVVDHAEPAATPVAPETPTCAHCNGKGRVWTGIGPLDCPACHGSGHPHGTP